MIADAETLAEEVADLEAALAKKKAALQKVATKEAKLTPAQRMANFLHKELCHMNHEDMCGWEYNSWERPDSSRLRYLEKAEVLLTIADAETVKKIIRVI